MSYSSTAPRPLFSDEVTKLGHDYDSLGRCPNNAVFLLLIFKFKIQKKPKIRSKMTQNAGKIHSIAMATNMAATFVQPGSAMRELYHCLVLGKGY